jgi:acetoacetate decarboxylase
MPKPGVPDVKINDVRRSAYAMPLTNPAFPRGPYRFFDREYLIVTYRTDEDALRAVVPEPLEVVEPIVKYEFIRMPDSTGFGDYTESGQVIPVRFRGEDGVYVHSMYLDDDAAIAVVASCGPKKLAEPKITHEGAVIVGTLHYGKVLCATATTVRLVMPQTEFALGRSEIGHISSLTNRRRDAIWRSDCSLRQSLP